MRVLFVTSECVPLFKLGGLGDVSYALPVALTKRRIHVTVALPYYAKIKLEHVACLGPLAVDFDRRRELVFVFTGLVPGTRVPLLLFRHPRLMDYKGDDIAETFAFYSCTVAAFCRLAPLLSGHTYDIVHCHDWHTALVPMLLGESDKIHQGTLTIAAATTRTILTIHNLLYQGETGIRIIKTTGLPPTLFHPFATPLGRAVRLLGEGLEYADVITTVSPTYAKEIVTSRYGEHIDTVLRRRKDRVVGILNGIDQTIWDPATDPALPVRFTRSRARSAKAEIKTQLRRVLGLPEAPVPLFGFVGRLEAQQKGIDIVREAVGKLAGDSFQLVILGTGAPVQVRYLERLVRRNPQVRFIHTFDERLARRIYAGADIMLVPSKFEPCGLTQMIAMRYGTIPLVRRTGGLADSVEDGVTGFVFDRYTAAALRTCMERAIGSWNHEPKRWGAMVDRVLRQDFSWDNSAAAYGRLYEKLVHVSGRSSNSYRCLPVRLEAEPPFSFA